MYHKVVQHRGEKSENAFYNVIVRLSSTTSSRAGDEKGSLPCLLPQSIALKHGEIRSLCRFLTFFLNIQRRGAFRCCRCGVFSICRANNSKGKPATEAKKGGRKKKTGRKQVKKGLLRNQNYHLLPAHSASRCFWVVSVLRCYHLSSKPSQS